MELQEILSKMEADGWEISDDFKTAHRHFLQYFIETVETALRQTDVSGSVCDHKDTYIVSGVFGGKWCEKCKEMVDKQTHD